MLGVPTEPHGRCSSGGIGTMLFTLCTPEAVAIFIPSVTSPLGRGRGAGANNSGR